MVLLGNQLKETGIGRGGVVAVRVWDRDGTEGGSSVFSFGGSCVCSCAGSLGTLGGFCVSTKET